MKHAAPRSLEAPHLFRRDREQVVSISAMAQQEIHEQGRGCNLITLAYVAYIAFASIVFFAIGAEEFSKTSWFLIAILSFVTSVVTLPVVIAMLTLLVWIADTPRRRKLDRYDRTGR